MSELQTYIEPLETALSAADKRAVLTAFEVFTHLPESEKERLVTPGLPGLERNTKAGYARKEAKDSKTIFHYTDLLAAELADKPMPAEARQFIAVAAEAHQLALRSLRRALHAMNPLYASTHF